MEAEKQAMLQTLTTPLLIIINKNTERGPKMAPQKFFLGVRAPSQTMDKKKKKLERIALVLSCHGPKD